MFQRAPFLWITAAVIGGTVLFAAAFYVHSLRPEPEIREPTAALVRASGKCASCHREQTGAIVHEYEQSKHAARHINCLECHGPAEDQESFDHRGFELARTLTAKNCAQCHHEQYQQFLRSRHAAPAWAAVAGREAFTKEQIANAEEFHPGTVDRDPNALAQVEGEAAIRQGCKACHAVGRPNRDGSIGDCTDCHSRHWASATLARLPRTCGQCHLGPDHSQLEIYRESKHGVLFHAQRERFNLAVQAEALTTDDMPVPTCATCHMSGLGPLASSHDTSPRLSYFLYAPISEERPNHVRNEAAMQRVCNQCHTSGHTEAFYAAAEATLKETNRQVREAKAIVDGLREDGLLTPQPYDEVAELIYFDIWHYYGRTAKHGAYMGGADYVQWHGFYPLAKNTVKLRKIDAQLREKKSGSADGDRP